MVSVDVKHQVFLDVPLVEFMYPVFTRMPCVINCCCVCVTSFERQSTPLCWFFESLCVTLRGSQLRGGYLLSILCCLSCRVAINSSHKRPALWLWCVCVCVCVCGGRGGDGGGSGVCVCVCVCV